jgi:predicted ATPase
VESTVQGILLAVTLEIYQGCSSSPVKIQVAVRKGYLPNWTDEVFVVVQCIKRTPRNVYKLADSAGEMVSGTFYENELQAVNKDLAQDEFEVEQVLKTRTNTSTGQREAFVKWKGWPTKFNSWVLLKDG